MKQQGELLLYGSAVMYEWGSQSQARSLLERKKTSSCLYASLTRHYPIDEEGRAAKSSIPSDSTLLFKFKNGDLPMTCVLGFVPRQRATLLGARCVDILTHPHFTPRNGRRGRTTFFFVVSFYHFEFSVDFSLTSQNTVWHHIRSISHAIVRFDLSLDGCRKLSIVSHRQSGSAFLTTTVMTTTSYIINHFPSIYFLITVSTASLLTMFVATIAVLKIFPD